MNAHDVYSTAPTTTSSSSSVWYRTPDFWHDVAANLVAFAIGAALVFAVERAHGKRVDALH